MASSCAFIFRQSWRKFSLRLCVLYAELEEVRKGRECQIDYAYIHIRVRVRRLGMKGGGGGFLGAMPARWN